MSGTKLWQTKLSFSIYSLIRSAYTLRWVLILRLLGGEKISQAHKVSQGGKQARTQDGPAPTVQAQGLPG